ncbi:hypothetical protein JAAARDRAFT_659827 [Jaapia argillacea MUCL 33604]|uniref:Carbohydrate-binding module family 18 protein n=1 Tax=Jaapia argillacea MUCL 33604 TaxID=933084 RepID=A0A067Q9S4_9AGAM|nr:hypothetical protein JAAARDRAFT_659827 [Jaapia argillacea MUCL 33604]
MKSFATLLVFVATLFVTGQAATLTTESSAADGCFWDGTAPFCTGHCPRGYVEEGRSSCGDGACCWTGYKTYCCPETN